MSQTIELREIETISKSVSESVHEVESLPRRLHDHVGHSTQSTAQPTTEGLQENMQTSPKKQAMTARIQFATLCWCLFLAGWNDGTTGPLLPRIREVYNIIAYTLQAPGPPFPVFVIAYVINGAGIAMQDAQANGYVASIKENAETKMGILHAAYGMGAFVAPLVATQFAQAERWSFHFLVSLGISLSNAVALIMVFRFKGQDECLAAMGQPVAEKDTSEHSKFRQILTQKTVHFLAFFILVYVGVEVTIGGWIVTFIIDVRHGGASSGYISSGFFGGLTVGRVALLWVNKKACNYGVARW
ncbi:hypothetical protein EYR38_002191 [Pleurotus pulmonarius]|nr:hypothetical protein EYR38_002191 [Pleurotus pulmonarius]